MVRLWDAGLWSEKFECRSVESFNPPLAVSPSGQVALCHEIEAGNALKLWDPDTGQETEIATSKSLFRSIAFSSDEQFLAAGDDDGRVWLWSLDSLDLVHGPRLAHGESVRSLAFSPDGRVLASGGGSPALLIWDLTTFEPHCVPGHIGAVYSVGFSDEGHLVTGGGIWRERGETLVWDLHGALPTRTSHPLLRLDHPGRIVLCAAISRDGTKVAATHDYSAGDIRVYDVATGNCLQTFLGHASRTMCVLFSPDGTRLATAGDDRTVRLWDVESGEPLGTLDVGERVRKMAFLPDGNGFVTASWEGRVRLWRAALASDIPHRRLQPPG